MKEVRTGRPEIRTEGQRSERSFCDDLAQWFSKCSPGAIGIIWDLLEMANLRPTVDLLNQKLWEWTQQCVY